MKTADYLLETGVEEIPAGYIPPALEALKTKTIAALETARLDHAGVEVWGTPRRLVLYVKSLAEKQKPVTLKIFGPKKEAAFDQKTGQPTKAAEGFAKSQGVTVAELIIESSPKGDAVCVIKEDKGGPVAKILPQIIGGVLSSLPFPKNMTWGDGSEKFVRPVHWLVSIYGSRKVPLKFAGVESGLVSRGRRFGGPASINIASAGSYLKSLTKAGIIVVPAERRGAIAAGAEKLASKSGGRLVRDDALLETITFINETPAPLLGGFDPAHLRLPRELLVATMKNHQKYFPIEDSAGKLMPKFVGVSNNPEGDGQIVVRGYERVLRARLADAAFFFDEDLGKKLAEFVPKLDRVTYHKKLGSVGDRVRRITAVAGVLADAICPAEKKEVLRAAELCKADLVTQMVYEFPELQGVMGREYAKHSGEPALVAQAIFEHYLPRGADDALPSSKAGAVLAMAEKIDSIAGCFGIGLIPTGSEDPFALRRACIGIISIVLGHGLTLDVMEFVRHSISAHAGLIQQKKPDEIEKSVLDFFHGRMKGIFQSRGLPPDAIDAALAVAGGNINDALARAKAVAELKKEPEFESVALAVKRVANICKGHAPGDVTESAFEHESERALWATLLKLEDEAGRETLSGDYLAALKTASAVWQALDKFFVDVMVMVDDPAVRSNRLNLLGRVNLLFARVADFGLVSAGTQPPK